MQQFELVLKFAMMMVNQEAVIEEENMSHMFYGCVEENIKFGVFEKFTIDCNS